MIAGGGRASGSGGRGSVQADAGGALAQLRTHVANKISHMDCPYTKFLHTPFYCE